MDAKSGERFAVTSKYIKVKLESYTCLTLCVRSDPATLEELGTIPDMGLVETKEAIDAAARAFPAWSRTTAKVNHTFGI